MDAGWAALIGAIVGGASVFATTTAVELIRARSTRNEKRIEQRRIDLYELQDLTLGVMMVLVSNFARPVNMPTLLQGAELELKAHRCLARIGDNALLERWSELSLSLIDVYVTEDILERGDKVSTIFPYNDRVGMRIFALLHEPRKHWWNL